MLIGSVKPLHIKCCMSPLEYLTSCEKEGLCLDTLLFQVDILNDGFSF